MNLGQHYGARRQMASTTPGVTDQIEYELYQNSDRTSKWGNTLNTDTLSATGTGVDQTYTVYGRITNLPVRPGTYTDTVTVIVTY